MRKVLASLVSMILALNTGVSFSYAAKTPTPRRTHRPITEFKTYTQEELANMTPRRYNSYSAVESNLHSSSLAAANSSFKSASKSVSKCHNNVKEKHWSARCPTAKPVIVASKQFDRPQPTKVPSATATVVPTTAAPKKTPVATTAAATKSRTPQPTVTATVAPSTPSPKPTVAPSTPAPKAEEPAGAKGSTMQEEEVAAEGAKGGEEVAEGSKGAEEVVEGGKGSSVEEIIPEEIIPEEVAKKHPAAQTGEMETAEEKKAREEEEFKKGEEEGRRIKVLVDAGFPNMAKLVHPRPVKMSVQVDTGVNGCPKLLIEPGTEKAIEEIQALGMSEDVVDFCKNNSLCTDNASAKLGNSTSVCDSINAVAAIPVNYGTFCHWGGREYICNENTAYNEKVETFLKDLSIKSKIKAAKAAEESVCTALVEVTNNSTATENVTAAEDPVVVQVVENNSTPPVENVTIPENATSVEEPVIVRVEPSQQVIDEAMEATRKRLSIYDEEDAARKKIEDEAMEAARKRVKNVGIIESASEEDAYHMKRGREEFGWVNPQPGYRVPSFGEIVKDSITNSDFYIKHENDIEDIGKNLANTGEALVLAAVAPYIGVYYAAKSTGTALKVAASGLVDVSTSVARSAAEEIPKVGKKIANTVGDVAKNIAQGISDIAEEVDKPVIAFIDNYLPSLGHFINGDSFVDPAIPPIKSAEQKAKEQIVFIDEPEVKETVVTQEETVVIPEDPANKSIDAPEVNISPNL